MLRFLQANWIWVLLAVGMLVMHSRHGGGCGAHHQHEQRNRQSDSDRLSGRAPRSADGYVANPSEQQPDDASPTRTADLRTR